LFLSAKSCRIRAKPFVPTNFTAIVNNRSVAQATQGADHEGMDRDNRYFIEALHRGLRVLEVFSEEDSSLGLTEIASACRLDKSTAFRFVHTLEELGYLERDPDSKRYRPGLKVLKLGFSAINHLDIVQLARPHLKTLSRETDEATNMALRDGPEIVYVARISPLQLVNINLRVGSRLPVHCTSMGKAHLLDLEPVALEQLLGKGPYEAFTPHTITGLAHLLADLEQARRQGYAVGDEELAVGMRSVAAPIRNAAGEITAAINISVSSARVSREELEVRLASAVVDSAEHISTALGNIALGD
jgi:IclR family pca regulon transcriptional regulator